MATFFTADLHLGHARIIELCNRPFRDVEHMNQELVANWNAHVKHNDLVYILGDLAMGTIEESLQLVKTLNGSKFLVPGNHDRVWPDYHRKGVKPADVIRYTAAGLIILDPITIYRNDWILCHFPDTGDSQEEDRYDLWRPARPDEGQLLIHGHVHNAWKVRGNRINVGVDVWDYAPVAESTIRELVGVVGSLIA